MLRRELRDFSRPPGSDDAGGGALNSALSLSAVGLSQRESHLDARVARLLGLTSTLAHWKHGDQFRETVTRQDVVGVLILRALLDVEPGAGEWARLCQASTLAQDVVGSYVSALFGQLGVEDRAEQLRELRRAIAAAKASGIAVGEGSVPTLSAAATSLINSLGSAQYERHTSTDRFLGAATECPLSNTKSGSVAAACAPSSVAGVSQQRMTPQVVAPEFAARIERGAELVKALNQPSEGGAASLSEFNLAQLKEALALRALASHSAGSGRGAIARLQEASTLLPPDLREILKEYSRCLGCATPHEVIPALQGMLSSIRDLKTPRELRAVGIGILKSRAEAERRAHTVERRARRADQELGDYTDALEGSEARGYDGLNLYFRDVGRQPLLSREEEQRLGALQRAGDEAAAERLVTANLRLVVHIAKGYVGLLPLAELISAGNVGLLKAAGRFNPAKGKFSSYAAYSIKYAIEREISSRGSTVRIPLHARSNLRKVMQAQHAWVGEDGEDPTAEELAAVTKLTVREVVRLLDVVSKIIRPRSLDAPLLSDSETSFGEVLRDPSALSAAEKYEHEEKLSGLWGLLDRTPLTPKERCVIEIRFGLDGSDEGGLKTRRLIGERFKLTHERIRQIEECALRKIRRQIHREAKQGRS